MSKLRVHLLTFVSPISAKALYVSAEILPACIGKSLSLTNTETMITDGVAAMPQRITQTVTTLVWR